MSLRFLFAIGLIISSAVPAVAQTADKDEATPDFCQTDKEGHFDDGGRKFCGPVAVSNSLMCLAQNGFPRLIEDKEPPKQAQIELIRTLGSAGYMATEGADGTGTQHLMQGAAKYVTEHGYQFAKLEYRGWRTASKELKPTQERPSLKWVSEAVANPRGAACVNIGWYTHDAATDTYTRHGGHWMTATGASPEPNDSLITLHDPAPRSGAGKVTHHAHVELLTSGTLTGTSDHKSTNAAGLFVIRDGIVFKQVVKGEKTYPIIDGIVVMVLR
jgi:hypothetical protein